MASSSTQATIRIPTRVLDAPPSSGDFVWPQGAWRGALEDVTEKDLPKSATGEPFKGFDTTDGTILNLKIGSNVYLDDEDQSGVAGNRKQFVEIVLSDGDRTIYDVDASEKGASYWKLQQSQRLALDIARALGQAEEDGEYTVMAEGFLEALGSGQFNGVEVGYTIAHSKPNAQGKVYQNVTGFFAS